MARELAGHVRASDVVARLGGDEFGVLMWKCAARRRRAKARELEIAHRMAQPAHGPARLGVGASAGVVPLAPSLRRRAQIAAADQAMYARKKAKETRSGFRHPPLKAMATRA